MKDIIILEDGKIMRASKAKLVKRGNKRVLIQFTKYCFETDKEYLVTEWFKIFLPSWSHNKKSLKHNNKRKKAYYYHEETNEFYCDHYLSDKFKSDALECWGEERYQTLFGKEGK